jgi:hypothetical protein
VSEEVLFPRILRVRGYQLSEDVRWPRVLCVRSSVVNPDPVGSETWKDPDPEKIIPDPDGPGSEMNYQKIFPKKLISRHNMQPNTLTKREYKGKIYVKKISRDLFDPDSGMEKFGSATMCLVPQCRRSLTLTLKNPA